MKNKIDYIVFFMGKKARLILLDEEAIKERKNPK